MNIDLTASKKALATTAVREATPPVKSARTLYPTESIAKAPDKCPVTPESWAEKVLDGAGGVEAAQATFEAMMLALHETEEHQTWTQEPWWVSPATEDGSDVTPDCSEWGLRVILGSAVMQFMAGCTEPKASKRSNKWTWHVWCDVWKLKETFKQLSWTTYQDYPILSPNGKKTGKYTFGESAVEQILSELRKLGFVELNRSTSFTLGGYGNYQRSDGGETREEKTKLHQNALDLFLGVA